MSCNCPGAPHLSGSSVSNLTKPQSDTVAASASWCHALGDGGTINNSDWSVSPESAEDPLAVNSQEIASPLTSATFSSGAKGTLYLVTNLVTLRRVPEAPEETLSHVFQVWIPGAKLCEDGC